MGKNIIQQRRGAGNRRYRSLGFKSVSRARHVPVDFAEIGTVVDIIKCPNHLSPLMVVQYDSGVNYNIAPEGVYVGQEIFDSEESKDKGNTLMLKDIQEGTQVCNIEGQPGDGGSYIRAPGTTARVLVKEEKYVTVQMPSKTTKKFPATCRATIGVVAGGGRSEKPMLKAGVAFFKAKSQHKLWPVVSGSAMNAVDHPFGNKRTLRKSKAKPVPKNAPAGRKVGLLRPRRTGKKK